VIWAAFSKCGSEVTDRGLEILVTIGMNETLGMKEVEKFGERHRFVLSSTEAVYTK
jgi:hypothetical protein